MNIKHRIHEIENLIIYSKTLTNSFYGIGTIPKSNDMYRYVFKLKQELSSLKLIEKRINKINKIKSKINEN